MARVPTSPHPPHRDLDTPHPKPGNRRSRSYLRCMSRRAIAAALTAVTAITACAHRTLPGNTVYRTVTVTPHNTAEASPSPVAAVRSPSSAKVMRKLPGTCDDLLSVGTIVDALGH